MKKLFTFILVLSVFTINFAQVPVKVSDEIVNLSGKKYYLHKTEKGQTLYSVSKAYNVSTEEIKKANKLSSDEIKAGQILKIPFKEIKKEDHSPDYFYHKVKKGETLFSLSQKYFVKIEDIIKTNPDTKYGLREGEILKIPNSFKKNKVTDNDKYIIYIVEQGNTLYSISRKFNTTVEEIIKLNPSAENEIKTGQKLKIPKTNNTDENKTVVSDIIINENTASLNKGLNDPLYFTEVGITPCNQYQYIKGTSFNVVLLLPLFINKNISYLSKYSKEKDPMFYKNTRRFTEYYEGFLLASEKLKKQGLSFNLKVYDTQNDSLRVKTIMNSLNYPNIDLIIGPVYSKNIKIASRYASQHHINLISPLSKNIRLITKNPFVFLTAPSKKATVTKLAEILRNHTDSTNLILVYDGSPEQFELINTFKAKYTENDTLNHLTDSSIFKIIKYNSDIKMMDIEQEKINKALKPKFKNIVFIPSNNEVFVTQVIDKFYAEADIFKIEIIGFDNWINYQNINSSILNKISFSFLSPTYVNYDSPEVKEFIKKYRLTYQTEPSDFSFRAYDLSYYFLNTLRKYGRIFQFCLNPNDLFPGNKGLIQKFDFERINTNSGFENKEVFLLQFDETLRLKEKEFKE